MFKVGDKVRFVIPTRMNGICPEYLTDVKSKYIGTILEINTNPYTTHPYKVSSFHGYEKRGYWIVKADQIVLANPIKNMGEISGGNI